MNKALVALGLSALLVFPTLTSVQAQPRNGGGLRGAGEMGGRSAKMQLNRMWRGIGALEKGKGPMNRAQAVKIVALVRPWSNRPSMSDSEASSLTLALSNVLTAAQKDQLKKLAGERRRGGDGPRGEGRGGGGWGGRGEGPGDGGAKGEGRGRGEGKGGRGGGAGAPDRQQMQRMMGFFRTVNPFYAPTGYKEFKSMPERMQKGMMRRYETSRAILVGLSKKAG